MDEPIRPRPRIPTESKPRVRQSSDQFFGQQWRCRGHGIVVFGSDFDSVVQTWQARRLARAEQAAGAAPFEVRL